jgi:hypothetical protein
MLQGSTEKWDSSTFAATPLELDGPRVDGRIGQSLRWRDAQSVTWVSLAEIPNVFGPLPSGQEHPHPLELRVERGGESAIARAA